MKKETKTEWRIWGDKRDRHRKKRDLHTPTLTSSWSRMAFSCSSFFAQ